MPYYTNFGQLQQELRQHYERTGRRLQFHEAVDALYERGELSETPPPDAQNQAIYNYMDLRDFSEIVDSFSFTVNPSHNEPEHVNEDDIIPLTRDVLIIRHPRYTRPYLHRHNYVEMDYVAEGRCYVHMEGEEPRTIEAGELCILSPYLRHDIEIRDESTVFCIMLRRSTFEGSFFSLLLHDDALSLFFRTTLSEASQPNYLLFRTPNLEPMQTLLQNAMAECHKTDDYANISCISYINLMFACILRSSEEAPLPRGHQAGADFSPVLRYIRDNYRTLTLAELAERFHYSKPYLCTLIRQNTGVSFTGLVKRVRMSHAMEYLLGSRRSVGEIAELVGYHSADHFSRVFRATYGVPPQEYRRQNQNQADRFIPFEMEEP